MKANGKIQREMVQVNIKVIIGRYTYSNGDIYEGEWKDGKRHGKGKYMIIQEL